MAPRRFSRYTFSNGFVDPKTGAFMLEDVEPVTFVDRSDNRPHVVVEGDTLHHLAAKYFPSFTEPSQFFWVIADFQPEPPLGVGQILDPTRKLPVGVTLIIPSERFINEEAFNEDRRTRVQED